MANIDPTATTLDLIGNPELPGSFDAFRFRDGEYDLTIRNTQYKVTMKEGDAYIVDFGIDSASNGHQGQVNWYLPMGKNHLEKQYRAADLTAFLRVVFQATSKKLGQPSSEPTAAQLKSLLQQTIKDSSYLNGITVHATVIANRKGFPTVTYSVR